MHCLHGTARWWLAHLHRLSAGLNSGSTMIQEINSSTKSYRSAEQLLV